MDQDKVWHVALGELEVTLSRANFTTWFRNTFIAENNDGHVVIGVPTAFAKEWLENKYKKEIANALRNQGLDIKTIIFKVLNKQSLPEEELPLPRIVDTISAPGGERYFNNRYTFEKFVVGNNNRLAYAVSKAVAERPGEVHNPLFLYGGVGLGKTHLVQAIGNYIKTNFPSKKVLYSSCEDFTNEFISSISNKTMDSFKKKYRGIDVFLVDDIQFLSSKEGTQQEFFHTFNALHQSNHQIVITSDRVPRAIPDLEERLSSRFGWGMVADIQPPNLETRLAILRAKCGERRCNFQDDVLEYIAQNIQSNIRELEGALNRIAAFCQLNNSLPTLDTTKQVLESVLGTRRGQNLSAEKILKTVADFFNLRCEDLLSACRQRELVYPRQITMYLMRQEMNFSYPRIGKELGGKDHTTIIHGVGKINKEIGKNENLQKDLLQIKEKLYLV